MRLATLKQWGVMLVLFIISLLTLLNAEAATNLPTGITQLPSYDNSQAIDNMLDRNQPAQTVQGVPPALLEQLQQLEQSQQQLMQRLQQGGGNGGNDTAASNSGIFFSGGSPGTTNNTNTAASTNTNTTKPATPTTTTGQNNESPVQQQLNFLNQGNDEGADSQINPNTVQPAVSPYIVQAGTFIPAVLQTAANSDVPGQISAIITQDIYDTPTGRFLLIPKGSKVIGLYNSDIPYGGSRLQVKFTRLIRPDGSSIVLTGPLGVDPQGQSGLLGDVDNHWWRVIGSGVLTALFTLPALVATQNQSSQNCTTVNGVYTCSPSTTVGSTALLAGATAATQFGGNIANKSLNIKPTLTLPAGTLFNIFVNKDMVIPPVNQPLGS